MEIQLKITHYKKVTYTMHQHFAEKGKAFGNVPE